MLQALGLDTDSVHNVCVEVVWLGQSGRGDRGRLFQLFLQHVDLFDDVRREVVTISLPQGRLLPISAGEPLAAVGSTTKAVPVAVASKALNVFAHGIVEGDFIIRMDITHRYERHWGVAKATAGIARVVGVVGGFRISGEVSSEAVWVDLLRPKGHLEYELVDLEDVAAVLRCQSQHFLEMDHFAGPTDHQFILGDELLREHANTEWQALKVHFGCNPGERGGVEYDGFVQSTALLTSVTCRSGV